MTAHTPNAAAPGAATPLGRGRLIAVWTLIVLASVLGLASILTTWVDRQMLDDHAWRRASTDVIQDPAVQSALSVYLVNQLYDNVDVASALEERLPSNLKSLGAPVAGALHAPAAQGVEFLLQRPRVQQLWISATALAHDKLVNVLENKTGHGISTGSGTVTLDTRALIVDLGKELGLPTDALQKLPADAGVITLMRSDQLAAAQKGVRVLEVLSAWLLVAVLALFAAAVYLARGHRRVILRDVGWAFVLVGLLVLVVRRLLGNYVTGALAAPGYDAATHALWLIGTAILGQIGAATILYGTIIVLGTVFVGPTGLATRLRRAAAPVLNERPGAAAGAVGFVFLLAVFWGGTHALRTWWGILLLGGLIAWGVVAVRRQTLQEFPARPPEERQPWHERLAAAIRPPEPAPPAPAPSSARRSVAEEIAALRDLHDSGAITDEEFARGKTLALT